MKKIVYYDLETTGLRHQEDRIVEIAAYSPMDDQTFVSFVNPERAIPEEASRVHGITDDMVASAPTFSKAGEAFCEFCKSGSVLVAHNGASFDKPFLEAELERNRLAIPEWRHVDSLKWARKYRSDLPKHTLQYLREVYGIAANQAHRALDDVMVLYQIFSSMIGDLALEDVVRLVDEGAQSIRSMPFGKHKGKPLHEVPKGYLTWLLEAGALDKAENTDLKASFMKLGLLPTL